MASIRLEQVTKAFNSNSITNKVLGRKVISSEMMPLPVRDNAMGDQDSILALNKLDFYVPDGQTTVVVGPSGCGKSTLLRVIAGLLDYQGGVYYDDRNMQDISVKERHIGMVFQNYALYPHFFGHGNLSFFFKINNAPDVETEERIRATSDIMGIGFSELLKRKPGTLSGGQQQRVAIGRAIVRQPELLLFDEPLSSLDAKLRTRTRVEIKRLLHRFNITAVYVTHDQTEAVALGDEIAVMRDGRIEQVGSYHQITTNPVNQFVAGFLGLPPMNLLEGHIENGEIFLDSTKIPLPQAIKELVYNGQTVNLGIRPEEIIIEALPNEKNCSDFIDLPSIVEVIEPDFGRQRHIIYLRYNNLTFHAASSLNASIHAGYTVHAYLPTSSIYFFDQKSGSRIGNDD